jgi:hypothetical protein
LSVNGNKSGRWLIAGGSEQSVGFERKERKGGAKDAEKGFTTKGHEVRHAFSAHSIRERPLKFWRSAISPRPSAIGQLTPCLFVPLTGASPPRNLGVQSKDSPVAVKSIQLGQVWRQDASGQDYLVTKVYSEVFAQFAVLRPAEVTAPDAPTVKVKVAKSSDGASLPGFTFTQEGSF